MENETLTFLAIFVVGGRYKIYMEEREGFVDSSLIIGNIVIQDHRTR